MAGVVFGREHVPLLTADEAADLDREAQDAAGVPEPVLMENAGRSAALVVHRLYPIGRVVAVVGSGNNGGDAMVLLRSLRAWGRDVAFLPAGSRDPDPSLLHGFDIQRIPPDDASRTLAEAGVLIDGLLGTGATGAPRGAAAEMVRAMNQSGRPVVAMDVPTGVDPTTGHVPGDAVRADLTICFGWPKRGCLLQPGRDHAGRVVAVEISFPPLAPDDAGAGLITPAWAARRLPRRGPAAHKNSVGALLALAGREGMGGAAAIAARSAIRSGVGFVRLASEAANRTFLQKSVPEAVFIDRADEAALREAADASNAVLAGPGIGTGEAAAAALDVVLEASGDRPCILDADALTILGSREGALQELGSKRPVVLTPHPGEMSRLTGRSIAEVQDDPLGLARSWADEHGCTLLLKGAPSTVAAPGSPVLVNSVGSSDMASAGMGDQLAGMIGAFLAAGSEGRVAAALGLFYGGRAGEIAERGRGLTPIDVAEHLHLAFAEPGPDRSPLELPFVIFDQPPRW